MAGLLDLLDPGQHEEASRAGRAELETVLDRRTQEERDAFWKALDLYYAPPPEEESDQPELLRQSPVQSAL
ncbi:hypothetical protein [Methylobacterium nigriterrae]|uniref:hypothetical protein n=1 Tax=Methylobacterium nigriterrae TaxID=3127512 RepID=UPI003013FA0D